MPIASTNVLNVLTGSREQRVNSRSVAHFVYPSTLNTQRILVHGDDLLVLQDGFVLWPDCSKIDGHQQRRRQYRPNRHLRFALLVTQPEVTDDQHVWIVPVSGTGVGYDRVLIVTVVIDNALHTGPGVLNVIEVAPEIAVFYYGGVIRLRIEQTKVWGGE